MEMQDFKQTVFDHYAKSGRSFPWRENHDPYAILVSEIMLQQTQTDRVVPKYEAFLKAFPTIQDLAAASMSDVLLLWQGLGYNRRGIALQRAAQAMVEHHEGKVPQQEDELVSLPGIGPYTAGAIIAFAYNKPVVMIETNIRRVFIHHFFHDESDISDKQIFPLIEASVDHDNPREWYYALMDYGAWLAKQFPNPNRRSKHYTKQSSFEGSNRQLRGMLMRIGLKQPQVTLEELVHATGASPEKIKAAVLSMQQEGFPLPYKFIES